jgi:4-hydroxymandelate oxidase
VFVASPPSITVRTGLPLIRAERRVFTGTAEFLDDPANRARTAEYLTDMARAYGRDGPASVAAGQSYGEMAEALIGSVVSADEPVDLLVLAFAVHDLWPSRQTAAYLSGVTPGTPLAFAICDQGSAAAFSGLTIAREYAASAGVRRALLIVVEQAEMPYDCAAPLPLRHQGVAMLYGPSPSMLGRVVGVRQHPGVAPDEVARIAAEDLNALAKDCGHVAVVCNDALASLWSAPAAGRVRVAAPGQPATGVWSDLIDQLRVDDGRPELVVAADYDPDLRYLCLTGFATGPDLST